MVHALREAWRVLRPGGLALDLRPAVVHRQVAVVRGGQPEPMGTMPDSYDIDLAADGFLGPATHEMTAPPIPMALATTTMTRMGK